MARQKVILTYEDYQKLPDNGTRKEILGGELFVTAALPQGTSTLWAPST